MGSTISTRMWRAHKASGRPWPKMDTDEVVDYLILEAVAAKAAKEEEEHQKEKERTNWKKDVTNLEQFR